MPTQIPLPFSALRNADFLSNHWLEKRLNLEPEWDALRPAASAALETLAQLWDQKKGLVAKYQDEAGLEQEFIQPVLTTLGWSLKYQAFLQGREPDYALFLNPEGHASAIHAGRKEPGFWKFPKLLADAKAWHISLDRPTVTNSQREFPPQQIEWYLNASQLDYAILTNGQLWRLIPRNRASHQPRFQTFLECNLADILKRHARSHLDADNRSDFLRFFLFFSPHAYIQPSDRDPLIARAIAGSSAYRLSASEGLKERVFEALRLCIEGFLNYAPNNLSPEREIADARANSFTLLYRLLFIFFAEDRQLLPFRKNQLYTKNRALSRFRDEIASTLDQIERDQHPELSKSDTSYWQDLTQLFDLIDNGKASYGVPAYNGGLFNTDAHPFLREKSLPDFYLARVIDSLGRAADPEHADARPFNVDYKDLAIQDLGNIYEGLLELRPHYASERMQIVRSKSKRNGQRPVERIIPDGPIPREFREEKLQPTGKIYEPGDVYLSTDKGERRASGSYYTPDHIVNYIVEKTLGPLCLEIDQKLSAQIAAVEEKRKSARGQTRDNLDKDLATLRSDFDDRILALKVLDPAMGSGHFLIRACQFLAEEIATNPHAKDSPQSPAVTPAGQPPERVAAPSPDDVSTLVFWKRKVVENCLYGVDLNPIAVELAKLALWLETVSTTQPLSFLDHHLRHGNSLVGGFVEDLGTLPGEPPLLQNAFQAHVEQKLPLFLGGLEQIRALPSDSVKEVKAKEKLFLTVVEPLRESFRLVADLWISTFFLTPSPGIAIPGLSPATTHISPADYAALINNIETPKAFLPVRNSAAITAATEALRRSPANPPFHWEIEFPDVFFDRQKRLPNPGFHAIIGNPPYEVIEKNRRQSDSPHQAFARYASASPSLGPAQGGKTNLFRYFLIRAIGILSAGGACGMIVPLAILADVSCSRTRRHLLDSLQQIEADCFPQKDNYRRRVFREAKLSTVVLVGKKRSTGAEADATISTRVFPWDNFLDTPRSCIIRRSELAIIDPDNLPIPLADEADWEICRDIHAAANVSRLADFSEFSVTRGEVNQSTYEDFISSEPTHSRMIKGSEVQPYCICEPRQGDREWFDETAFLVENTPWPQATQTRIATQRITGVDDSRRLIAAIVRPPAYFADSTNSIVQASAGPHSLEYLLALLNSTLFQWRFRLTSTNNNVSTNELLCMPIRRIDTSNVDDASRRDRLIRAAQEMAELQTHQVSARTAGNSAVPTSRSRDLTLTIDKIVFDLYRLQENQIAHILEAERRRGGAAKVS